MLFKYSEKVELLRVTACSKRPVSLRRAKSICFLSKNKKNQNKEEKIIVFCWLSTSLVKGFSFFFIHGGKNSLLFLQRNALWCFGVSKIPEIKRNKKMFVPLVLFGI